MLGSYRHRPPAPPESVFVHGHDETAISVLVVGLALRRHGSFSWADCAVPPDGVSARPRRWFARGRSRPVGDGVAHAELAQQSWSPKVTERLLIPENRLETLHLMSYLALPALLQELAALSTSPTGESTVLLANVDALDPRLRASVLGEPEVHMRLLRSNVTLFVTSHGKPTRPERDLFTRILGVEVGAGAAWHDGVVAFEKGFDGTMSSAADSLRSAWGALGLDPTLLPPT